MVAATASTQSDQSPLHLATPSCCARAVATMQRITAAALAAACLLAAAAPAAAFSEGSWVKARATYVGPSSPSLRWP